MLVLSRKKNETIVIDGGIEVEILQTKGGTVKVGIKAPRDVKIIRGELDVYSDLETVCEPASSIESSGLASVVTKGGSPASSDDSLECQSVMALGPETISINEHRRPPLEHRFKSAVAK